MRRKSDLSKSLFKFLLAAVLVITACNLLSPSGGTTPSPEATQSAATPETESTRQ